MLRLYSRKREFLDVIFCKFFTRDDCTQQAFYKPVRCSLSCVQPFYILIISIFQSCTTTQQRYFLFYCHLNIMLIFIFLINFLRPILFYDFLLKSFNLRTKKINGQFLRHHSIRSNAGIMIILKERKNPIFNHFSYKKTQSYSPFQILQ